MEFVAAADFEDVHEKRQYAFSRKVASAVVNDSWNIIELPPSGVSHCTNPLRVLRMSADQDMRGTGANGCPVRPTLYHVTDQQVWSEAVRPQARDHVQVLQSVESTSSPEMRNLCP